LFPRLWHQMARTKIISNDFQRDRIYLLIIVQFTKLLKPFLVEKELHYDNVISFYYGIFGVNCLYGNASEGSLVILKMTVKTTIICRIILSIREMIYTREIFPDMSIMFALFNPNIYLSVMESAKLEIVICDFNLVQTKLIIRNIYSEYYNIGVSRNKLAFY